jgi:FKBP-type peptidyl-prolyl cis-trans isomerase
MEQEQAADEKAKALVATIKQGQDFLQKNKTKPGVKSTQSGLQYQILKFGNGRRFKLGDTISYQQKIFDIKGNLLYDSYQPARHAFSGFSMGLDFALEAFSMMPAGSRYKFFVPNQLAYKEREVPLTNGNIIQPGAALIVEYELLSVKRPVAEVLKEEARIDSILVKLMKPELVKSYNKVKEDSLFCITLSRSFEEEKRTELWVETAILYREADGYYPTDSYGSDILYNINESGSTYAIFYIASPSTYKTILNELEARAKSLGIKMVKEKKIKYENERPRKKLTGEDFWNKF